MAHLGQFLLQSSRGLVALDMVATFLSCRGLT